MGPTVLTKLAAPLERTFSVSNDSKYPNEQTRKIIGWCEAVGEIKEDDKATLPRLLKQTDTKTLMGVFASYDGMLEDHRNQRITARSYSPPPARSARDLPPPGGGE